MSNSTVTAAKPLIPYIRQSRAKEQTISLDDQRRMIASWAASHPDIPLGKEVVEQGVSGNKPWRLRELGTVVKACEDGRAGGIIVAFQDRLSRENALGTAEVWEALQSCGARFVACDGVDSAAEGSELLFTVKAAIARENWKTYKKRNDDARRDMIERGVHGGSDAPLGYDWTRDGKRRGPLKPNADATRVAAAFEARVAGASWTELVRLLGVKSQGHAQAILANRVYLGEARSGDYVKPDAHLALVSEELFRRTNRRKIERSVSYGKRKGALLGGKILRCATCGHSLTFDASKKGDHYHCKNLRCTGRASVQASLIEPYVFYHALAHHAWTRLQHVADVEDASLSVFEEELAKAQAEREEIEELHAAGELSPVAYGKALTAAERQIAVAESAVAEAESSRGWLGMDTTAVQRRLFGVVPEGETFPESFARFRDIEQGRDFIRQMVRIWVMPVGRGRKVPVMDRVEIDYLTPGADSARSQFTSVSEFTSFVRCSPAAEPVQTE
jgi:DNA invertase Pin-like site-specific DNA recombinase